MSLLLTLPPKWLVNAFKVPVFRLPDTQEGDAGDHWATSPSGQCDLPPTSRGCGAGSQYQTVTCMRWDGAVASDAALCDPAPRPRARVDCHVPCPTDCIVSSWSGWSACPGLRCEGLGGGGGGGGHLPHQQLQQHRPRLPLRQRNRTVIAVAGRDGQVRW